MLAPPTFPGLIAAAAALARRAQSAGGWAVDEEPVLSLALPLQPKDAKTLDPLALLPALGADPFRFLWDGAPGLCLAASGRCNSLQLSGPRRFELAQRFCGLSLQRLATSPEPLPPLARPRVVLAFAFFDSPLDQGSGAAGVEAVLPRWQLSRQGRHCWLRLQRALGGAITPRGVAEELWEMARHLEGLAALEADLPLSGDARAAFHPLVDQSTPWRQAYRLALQRGLALVEGGELDKLVLAARQRVDLRAPLDPRQLLAHLRRSQPGSCRFLWQRGGDDALLGASPERLLTLRQGVLRTDALAGTRPSGVEAAELLGSVKDRHEHELVVETITQVLHQAGLAPHRARHPRLARHGGLVHLHTPITAAQRGQTPLALAEALHPTPAVAGLPRREAMAWLRSLEPFERGHYAAPIGWIDSQGDSELRVAIRCGLLRQGSLEITAGAGLVRGSVPEREEQEVALKLRVLRDQLLSADLASSRAIV